MALTNNRYDITELAKVDANGFQAALFPQIKDAYVKKMQEIYGYDIDVSSGSADGQYVMAQSLVLNNIYRTMEALSDNLSPASASGTYLDVLASLSGAFRRGRTYSTATVYIANGSTTDQDPEYLLLNDKNGNRWQWINPIGMDGKRKVTFPAKDGTNWVATAITVTCTELGAINATATGTLTEGGKQVPVDMSNQAHRNAIFNMAPKNRGGDIYETVSASMLAVYQKDSAVAGSEEETDASLRARRLRSFGQSGRTVEDSLVANLLSVSGVTDAYVIPNDTSADLGPVADGVTIPSHSVYVTVATQAEVAVPDIDVALTIYNTMTPGIPTYAPAATSTSGVFKSEDIKITDTISNTVKWKATSEIQPKVELKLILQNGTTSLTADQFSAIKTAAMGYMNDIPLGTDFSAIMLKQLVEAADFRTTKYGLPTYQVQSVQYLVEAPSTVSGNLLTRAVEDGGSVQSTCLSKFHYTKGSDTVEIDEYNNNFIGTFTIGDDATAWPKPIS